LEAIVPIAAISSWYDYYRADGAVVAPGTFQGEDLDVLAKFVYTRADQEICKPIIAEIESSRTGSPATTAPSGTSATTSRTSATCVAACLRCTA